MSKSTFLDRRGRGSWRLIPILPGMLVLTSAFIWLTGVQAQRLPPDPVQAFREALKGEKNPGASKEALEYRKENLTAKAKNLVYLGDLARVLVLQEWSTQGNREVLAIDNVVRDELGDRFVASLRKVLLDSNIPDQVAAAQLMGEAAAAVRAQAASHGNYLRARLSTMGPDLEQVIKGPAVDPGVRAAAALALGRIEADPTLTVNTLKAALGAKEIVVRRAAARALVEAVQIATTKKPETTSSVPNAVPEKDKVVSVGSGVTRAASEGMRDPDPLVRRNSVEAILDIAANAILLVPKEFSPSDFPAPERKALSNIEVDAIKSKRRDVEKEQQDLAPLLTAFEKAAPVVAKVSASDEDAGVRIQARQVLQNFALVRAKLNQRINSVPKLEGGMPPEALLDTIPAPRQGGPIIVPFVLDEEGRPARAVTRPVAAVQPAQPPKPVAADPLGDGLRRALDDVVKGLSDPNVRGRLAAMEVLEAMGGEAAPALPAITNSLADPDKFVRWAAARTIGRMAPLQPSLTMPKLAALSADIDLDVKMAALIALQRYGPEASAVLPQIVTAASHGDGEGRIEAMKALEAIGLAAVPTIPVIVGNLNQANPRVRQSVCEILGRFGTKAAGAEPALLQAMKDPNPDVRCAAADSLLRVTGK